MKTLALQMSWVIEEMLAFKSVQMADPHNHYVEREKKEGGKRHLGGKIVVLSYITFLSTLVVFDRL